MEEEHIIIGAANRQAFTEPVLPQEARQGAQGVISRFGLKNLLPPRQVGTADDAGVKLGVPGVWTIVVPIVPDRQRNFVRNIAQEFPGEEPGLVLLPGPRPMPG